MDSFNIIHNVKAEKRNAMLKYRRVRNIGIVFRFFEVCLVLILILSWFSSTRLPDAVKISGEYFKHLSVFVVSPRFVFLIGNAIILTLFAKSGRQSTSGNTSLGTDVYDEYIKISNNNKSSENPFSTSSTQEQPEEIVTAVEDKLIDKEIQTSSSSSSSSSSVVKKSVQRSQSVNANHSEKYGRELRRTETDICRNVVEIPEKKSEKKKKKNSFADDQEEMSNEEFQRKIEAFIAKQMRFHKEESMAIVLQDQSREEQVIIRSMEIKV